MLKEFKEFALRGNVVDLAVGMMIGSAFGGVVASLVNDIFTPLIALLFGSTDFSHLRVLLRENGDASIYLNYGTFIQTIINFIIMAFCIFLVVKAMNKLKKQPEVVEEAPAEPVLSDEAKALNEIIEILKNK